MSLLSCRGFVNIIIYRKNNFSFYIKKKLKKEISFFLCKFCDKFAPLININQLLLYKKIYNTKYLIKKYKVNYMIQYAT